MANDTMSVVKELVDAARQLGCLPVCICPLYAYGGGVFTGEWVASVGIASSRGITFDALIIELRDKLCSQLRSERQPT